MNSYYTREITANGHTIIPGAGYNRNIVFSIQADSNVSGTIKFKGGVGDIGFKEHDIDYTSGQSTSNHWGYVAVRKLDDASLISGSVGVTLSSEKINNLFEVETNGLDSFAIETSGFTGKLVVRVLMRGDD